MTAARTSCFLTLALVAAWGCTSVDVEPDKDKEEQPAAEAETEISYAGVWKRPDTGAVFEVKDDGQVVKGTLKKGTWLWVEEGYADEELFESFTFRLERDGDNLTGKAAFRFPDSQRYASEWTVSLSGEGDTLTAVVEELEIGDDEKVASRTKIKKTFAFEPATPRAPPTVAHGAADQDMTAAIKAPGQLILAEGVEIGFRVEIETRVAGHVMKHFLAVVGEEGDQWRVESTEGLSVYGAKDSIMGLLVEKESGKVTRAVLGKAGEAGKELQIAPMTAAGPGGAAGEEVDVETPAGTFPALLTTTMAGDKAYKSWVGREGDLEGVLLKFEGPGGKGKALKTEPETQSLDLGETVEARRCTYDNGDEVWHSSDEIVKALAFGTVRYKAGGVVREVKAISSQAKPQLTWE